MLCTWTRITSHFLLDIAGCMDPGIALAYFLPLQKLTLTCSLWNFLSPPWSFSFPGQLTSSSKQNSQSDGASTHNSWSELLALDSQVFIWKATVCCLLHRLHWTRMWVFPEGNIQHPQLTSYRVQKVRYQYLASDHFQLYLLFTSCLESKPCLLSRGFSMMDSSLL